MRASITFEEFTTIPKVFLDTQVITVYPFVREADLFLPKGEERVIFTVTLPILRELERIKDNHWNGGQRKRAREAIAVLDDDEQTGRMGTWLTQRSGFCFRPNEPAAALRWGTSSDDRFVACVQDMSHFGSQGKNYVLSDDVGVRVRAKQLGELKGVIRPDQSLRLSEERFELSAVVRSLVKDISVAVAAELYLLADSTEDPKED